jgi:hypothetical protein
MTSTTLWQILLLHFAYQSHSWNYEHFAVQTLQSVRLSKKTTLWILNLCNLNSSGQKGSSAGRPTDLGLMMVDSATKTWTSSCLLISCLSYSNWPSGWNSRNSSPMFNTWTLFFNFYVHIAHFAVCAFVREDNITNRQPCNINSSRSNEGSARLPTDLEYIMVNCAGKTWASSSLLISCLAYKNIDHLVGMVNHSHVQHMGIVFQLLCCPLNWTLQRW